MGCATSTVEPQYSVEPKSLELVDCSSSRRSKWKNVMNTKKARVRYACDKSMPKDFTESMFELRLFMEEAELLKSLADFASSNDSGLLKLILFWVDVQTFRTLNQDGSEQQRLAAWLIFENFVKIDSVQCISSTELDGSRVEIERSILECEENSALPVDLFVDFQLHCFEHIYKDIWVPYRISEKYFAAVDQLKNYNHVEVDDFQYMEKLGEGGFGFVVHAVKMSTGKHYAMKVQSKHSLLNSFADCPHRVTFEKDAMARCNHPFIIGLDYALQTHDVVLTAMQLGKSGTLFDSQMLCDQRRMPEARVHFYTAEIVIGLAHMHRMGFMYRDLKPDNILLMPNGHIKLTDLGGVVDPQERLLKSHRNMQMTDTAVQLLTRNDDVASRRNLFASVSDGESASCRNMSTISMLRSKTVIEDQAHPDGMDEPDEVRTKPDEIRSDTVIGTQGYMAPEMVGARVEGRLEEIGYSKAVDWWSLGITMTELLMGRNPFKTVMVQNYVSNCGVVSEKFGMFVNDFQRHPNISDAAFDIISKFLIIDDLKRLGSGTHPLRDIKACAFFEGMDWNKLGQRLLNPPFIPDFKPKKEVVYESFDEMTKSVKHKKMSKHTPFLSPYQQNYFAKWDYVAPDMIKLELEHTIGHST